MKIMDQTVTLALLALGAMLTIESAAPRALVAQTPSVTPCHVTAYTNDPDPHGTNVRKSPSSKSATLATLTDSDAQIDITGSSETWLEVRQARSVDGTVTFKGDGWVFAPLVAVRARGAVTLHASADKASAKTGAMKDDDQAAIVGCKGEWMQVKVKGVTGWMEPGKQCGNPVTTCS